MQSILNRQGMFKHANNKHKEEVSQTWLKCNECPVYFPTRWEQHTLVKCIIHQIDQKSLLRLKLWNFNKQPSNLQNVTQWFSTFLSTRNTYLENKVRRHT